VKEKEKAQKMDKPKTYCHAIAMMKPEEQSLHKIYHDTQYGFAVENDDELFCRLILEINQAGLSWTTILKKQDSFRKAYHHFNIKKVAAYNHKDVERLLNNAGIIRNRLKINAAIENAKKILVIQKQFGSFKNWLVHHHPKDKDEWVKLFKQNFKFTGGEIVNEFLVSTGYLPGAHYSGCLVYKKILKKKPMWNEK
jgi:DNA-3-methyladenine glycosylase I